MASAAAGGAGGELLHFLKLLFHIGKYLGHHRTIVSAAFAQSFAPSVQG